jgi:hypothetical protein
MEQVLRNKLYSLIPLEEFKAITGVDDKEDKIARFCLVTATFTIQGILQDVAFAEKTF